MNITACICSFNEESNIPRLMKSLEGLDKCIFADDGSTDNTVKLAESLGAKVFRRKDHTVIPTVEDVSNFKERFGFYPKFNIDSKISNGGACRNEALSYAKNDWCLNVDCDEIVTWDLKEIKKQTDNEKDEN